MSRFRASGIHLLISIFLMSLVLALMLLVWYPGNYFEAMGGGKLLFILAGVDVVIGPLLTLVIFKAGKKGLRLDLAMIALLQILALGYGVTVMFQARPAFMVFVDDKFKIASAGDLEEKHLAAARRPEWRRIPLTGPVLVAARMPEDKALRAQVVRAALELHDLDQFPESYIPYADARADVLKAAKPLSELRKIAPGNPAVVDRFLEKSARPESEFVFVPLLTSRLTEMAVVLDAKTAAYQSILPAIPWGAAE